MTNEHKTSKAMNAALWTAQAILAASLVWAAAMKLLQPADQLAAMWPWTAANPGLTKFTGILDLLAAIGLIFPALLRIQPKLTIAAAYGILLLMVAAAIMHIARDEASLIGINVFFAVLAGFIAWGRQTKAPIAPKR